MIKWDELLVYRRPAVLFSAVLILLSLVGVVYQGGLLYGIDFTGGLQILLEFDRTIGPDRMGRLRSLFNEQLFESKVNTVSVGGERQRRGLMITVRSRPLVEALTARLHEIGRDGSTLEWNEIRPDDRAVTISTNTLRQNFTLGNEGDTGNRINLRRASREQIRSRVQSLVNETLSEDIADMLRREFVGDTGGLDLNRATSDEIQSWLARRQSHAFVKRVLQRRREGLGSLEELEPLLGRFGVPSDRFRSVFVVGSDDPDRIDLTTVDREGFREIVYEEFFRDRYGRVARSIVETREQRGLFRSKRAVLSLPVMQDLERSVLAEAMVLSPFVLQQSEMVSPAIGAELIVYAALAILLSLLGILAYLYVRFELMYSLGAIAAILHDVVVTVGLLTLIGIEFNVPVVAAVLTIIGYSINDTIVNFDRVRENRTLMGHDASWYDIINRSVYEVLNRTLVTSVTTFLAVLVLYLYGGIALRAFSITLLIGVVMGTYSSIYVSNLLLYRLQIRGTTA